MRIASLVVISLVTAGVGRASADAIPEESPATRAARYYAEGLDRPLAQLRGASQLVGTCANRLKRICDEQNHKLAAGGNILELLDALTLFPTPIASDAIRITRARDLETRLGETGAALVRAAGEYDLRLFARYGATLRACPPDEGVPEYLESLAALVELDLAGFQALDAAAAAEATENYTREENALAARLRAGDSEDCIAARTLGEDLMRLMDSKLQPWNVGDADADNPARAFDFNKPVKPKENVALKTAQDRERTETVARNFITMAATLLQLTAYPESAARIREIANREGVPAN
jgi:hypothetical protein